MAVTNKWYGKAFVSAFNKEIDFDSDDIRAMLVTSSYTFNQDTHQYYSSITNEVTGTGYTANGVALTGESVSYDGASNTLKLDADDAVWGPGATITARGCVIYDRTPASDATRPLLQFIDFGADVAVSAGTLTVAFNAAGIATVTVA